MTRTVTPRIGIPIRLAHPSDRDERIEAAERIFEDIVALVIDSGGEPVRLPPEAAVDETLLTRCDGFVLPGGGDVDPVSYGGDTADATLFGVDPRQDAFDVAIANFASRTARPLLAICRGMQLVNVARGGTLHINLAPSSVVHLAPYTEDGEVSWSRHDVTIAADTIAAGAFGGARLLRIACSHHQAIDRVGDGLRVSARAVDGCIEAVESDEGDWLVGVQWHPEADHPSSCDDQRRLFAELTEQARRHLSAAATVGS